MNINIQDNIYMYTENFNQFLLKRPEIPTCQRSYIKERIDQFYHKLIKDNNPYLGLISCALLTMDGTSKLYIVDGQHRFYALKRYNENFEKSFNINYIVKLCTKKEEVVDFFKALNDNYNLHDIILDNLDIAESIKNHIKSKYDKHISNSETPRYPNVNLDQVTKYIMDTFKDSSNPIEEFEKLNEDVYESIKDNEKFNKSKQGLYLGYLFTKSESDSKRKHLPATLRHKLWNDYFENSTVGSCYVCSTSINNTNFHAGHITSVKNGGSDNISNLIPVCSCCNLSMGTQNLEMFKSKYFN